MKKTNAFELHKFGQSVWLDNINRSLIESGKLSEFISFGLMGMTSNPTIFEKAIKGKTDYDTQVRSLSLSGKTTFDIYDEITVGDIQKACDAFKGVYEATRGIDGYVSLEVNPTLAFKAKETIDEAERLHGKVNRPNVMFKVPSTEQGFPAAEELTSSGINVNVTLIFSLGQYIKTAHAYTRGIRRFLEAGGDASGVRSVASVFVSRVDTFCDRVLKEKIANTKKTSGQSNLEFLLGKAAVANSSLIYEKYREMFFTKEFLSLAEKGANIQRVLWGSTSTKNPEYNDIKYVTELIGRDSVNTMPQETFSAFLDHGKVEEALTGDAREAHKIINRLKEESIDIDEVCEKLLQDGVLAFQKSFDSLMHSIEQKAAVLCKK